ncbi:MAG: PIN domain-containing protein [Candidatus Aenigmatarchaeota archaeon]
MYCLDSSIFIPLLRGDKGIKKMLDSVEPESISITTITLCELFRGAFKSRDIKNDLATVHGLIRDYKTLAFDVESSQVFGEDFVNLEKSGKQTQVLDLMIASITKSNNMILVTRNKKHFENIPDLKVEEW